MHYAPEKSAIIWKIKQFGGGKEFLMRAELGLPSVKGDDEHGGGMTGGFGGSMGGAGQGGKGKRPISVKFEIPYFTTSGIQVRYLKIIEPKVRDHTLLLFLTPHRCGDRATFRLIDRHELHLFAPGGMLAARLCWRNQPALIANWRTWLDALTPPDPSKALSRPGRGDSPTIL